MNYIYNLSKKAATFTNIESIYWIHLNKKPISKKLRFRIYNNNNVPSDGIFKFNSCYYI